MKLYLDRIRQENGRLNATGWAVPEKGSARLSYEVLNKDGTKKEAEILFRPRPDISAEFLSDPYRDDAAFFIDCAADPQEALTLLVTEKEGEQMLGEQKIALSVSAFEKREKLRAFKRSLQGPIDFLRRVENKLTQSRLKAYHHWFLRHRLSPEEAERERNAHFACEPKFSIVVPLYRTPERVLFELVESVLQSTYANYELVLANASTGDEMLEMALKNLSARDDRIKVLPLPNNGGIARNTNDAVHASTGEFIGFMDHDDLLEPDALYCFAEALNAHPEADVLYSDEDKVSEDSTLYYDPNFKPDFSPALLHVSPYICHFTAVRASLFREIGELDPEYDGAQDYDLMLRFSERTERFVHVPRVLYHWRSSMTSTASGVEKKEYAGQAGIRALNAHLKRIGIPAVGSKNRQEGRFSLKFDLPEKPLVTVLIPNRDHPEDLRRAAESVYEKTSYGNVEVLVIENQSTDPETFRLYEELAKKYPSFRILAVSGPFNYARYHNEAAEEARGEYLLLLNNDTEILTADFIDRLVGQSLFPKTGAVGGKALYPDGTVQHAGIVTGEGGIAFHPFKGIPKDAPDFMARALTPMNVSAVTGACLMIRKDLYEAVGGMDENLSVALNDVDLCFKLREKGYRITVDQEALLTHYESLSRGSEETKDRFVRYGEEIRYFAEKWKGSKLFPDPYYPPVFSLLYGYQRKE